MEDTIIGRVKKILNVLRKNNILAFLQPRSLSAALFQAKLNEKCYGKTGWCFVKRSESLQLPVTITYGTNKEEVDVTTVGNKVVKAANHEFCFCRIIHNRSKCRIEIR